MLVRLVSLPSVDPLCPSPQEGRELSLEKPELKALVSEKLGDLHQRWDELESTTQAKARSLFDANRAELFAQSCSALESWLESLQAQLHSDDYGKDLTSVNILLKKQQVLPGCRGSVGTVRAAPLFLRSAFVGREHVSVSV